MKRRQFFSAVPALALAPMAACQETKAAMELPEVSTLGQGLYAGAPPSVYVKDLQDCAAAVKKIVAALEKQGLAK